MYTPFVLGVDHGAGERDGGGGGCSLALKMLDAKIAFFFNCEAANCAITVAYINNNNNRASMIWYKQVMNHSSSRRVCCTPSLFTMRLTQQQLSWSSLNTIGHRAVCSYMGGGVRSSVSSSEIFWRNYSPCFLFRLRLSIERLLVTKVNNYMKNSVKRPGHALTILYFWKNNRGTGTCRRFEQIVKKYIKKIEKKGWEIQSTPPTQIKQ